MTLVRAILFPFELVFYGALLLITAVSKVFGFIGWMFTGRSKPNTIHGESDWADYKKLKKAGAFQPIGWMFGLFEGRRLYTHPEASVMTIAPKRMGKTQSTIAAMLEQIKRLQKPDFMVFDPAGDITEAVMPALTAGNYERVVIDLTNTDTSDKIDILAEVDWRDLKGREQFLTSICEGIVASDAGGRDEHWTESGRGLVYAMLFGMMEDDPSSATMFGMAERLTNVYKRKEAFDAYKHISNPTVFAGLNAFIEAGEKERGSFTTTLTRKVRVWLLQSVRDITTRGPGDKRWTFDSLWNADRPCYVAIITGLRAEENTEGAVARTIINVAVNSRQRMYDRMKDKKAGFKRPWLIVTDETWMLGNCVALVVANVQLRKTLTRLWVTFPSLESVRGAFGKSKAAELIGGCVRVVFGGGAEMDTYEEMSRMFGDRTIENPSYNQSAHGQSSGASAMARRLIKPEEIRALDETEFVALDANLNVKGQKAFSKKNGGVIYH